MNSLANMFQGGMNNNYGMPDRMGKPNPQLGQPQGINPIQHGTFTGRPGARELGANPQFQQQPFNGFRQNHQYNPQVWSNSVVPQGGFGNFQRRGGFFDGDLGRPDWWRGGW